MASNLSAEVVLKWGDDKYLFALKGRQIEYLEKVCGGGIQEIAERLFGRRAKYKDIRETVLQGLIGGGMSAVDAADLVAAFLDGRPLAPDNDPSGPLATAQAVMSAVFFGIEDLEKGEAGAGETPAKNSTSPDGAPPSSETA